MSTQIRLLVHCDEKRSKDCAGLIEFRGDSPHDFEAVGMQLYQQGWIRGYSVDGTYDACPACAPGVEARLQPAEHPSACHRSAEHG